MRKLTYSLFLFTFIGIAWWAIPHTTEAAASSAGANVNHNGAVYFIAPDGKKRLYPTSATFLSYKDNSWAGVSPASPEDLALPVGAPMPFREGAVVCSSRLNDSGTCYLVTGGKRAAFASQAVMAELGFKLSQAFSDDVAHLASAAPIVSGTEAHRFGAVINHNGLVYYAGINGLMPISSPEILYSWGYNFSDVVPANSADLARKITFLVEPKVVGETWPFEPVIPTPLTLANEDKFIVPVAGPTPTITEAWLYSPDERSIHGAVQHGGIDFASSRLTPVYAAADGYAISSTHLAPLARTHESKPVGFGLGEFVQIWHPKQGVYTSYSHLQKVVESISYFEPKCEEGSCDPEVVYNSTDYMEENGVFVKQGELIGWMGDSGLSWGYTEQPRVERDVIKQPSWDEIHLHFEMYTRSETTFFKARRYDPFGIYGRLDQYTPGSYTNPDSLWKLNQDNKPIFAD